MSQGDPVRCDMPMAQGRVGKVAWVAGTVLIVAAVTIVLLIITANKDDEFWRVAVPTYLTGVGTLALAVLNVILLRQEAADRAALAAVQAEREAEDARREARKIVTTSERVAVYEPQPEVIRVLNAGAEPIFDVQLVKASSKEGWPIERFWHWRPDTGHDATDPRSPAQRAV